MGIFIFSGSSWKQSVNSPGDRKVSLCHGGVASDFVKVPGNGFLTPMNPLNRSLTRDSRALNCPERSYNLMGWGWDLLCSHFELQQKEPFKGLSPFEWRNKGLHLISWPWFLLPKKPLLYDSIVNQMQFRFSFSKQKAAEAAATPGRLLPVLPLCTGDYKGATICCL